MRTGAQQRYYEVLRREEHRKSPGRTAAPFSGPSSSSTASPPLWDPIASLHLDSTTVAALRELACDHRDLVALHPNFLRLEQLDSLVLNHNHLQTLRNLLPPPAPSTSAATASLYGGCRRLTRLHVSHNALVDLARDTDIPRLQLLEHLSVAHNKLTDLDAVLKPLRRLRHLRYLDLRGNPVIDEPAYRQRCIAALPQVEVLDGLTITQEERRDGAGAANVSTSRLGTTALHNNGGGTVGIPSSSSSASSTGLAAAASTRNKTASTGRFGKSAIARDLDVKYATHLRREQQEKAAAVEARAAAERGKEETWEAFHAVWSLSQPGMPLSGEGWRAVTAAAGTGATTTTAALAALPSPTGINGGCPAAGAMAGSGGGGGAALKSARKTPSPSSPSPGAAASRPRTPVPGRTPPPPPSANMADEAGGVGGGGVVYRSVEVPRDRLLPPLTSSPSTTVVKTQHDSPYLRTVRGTATQDGGGDYATSLSGGPLLVSPGRLTALQCALQASTEVVRATNGNTASSKHGSSGPSLTLSAAAAAAAVAAAAAAQASAGTRKAGGRASLVPSSASPATAAAPSAGSDGTTVPIDLDALRVVQRYKYALIPPPWELHDEGKGEKVGHGFGHVQKNTVVQEALTEVLVLLHQLFTAEELQLMELEYGRAELLRLLPLPEWAANADTTTTTTTNTNDGSAPLDTLRTARQEMLLLLRPDAAPSTAGGGRRLISEDRRKAAGGRGNAGGGPSAQLTSSAAAGGGVSATLSASELAAAATAVARSTLPVEPELVWDLFLQPYIAGAPVAIIPAAAAAAHGSAALLMSKVSGDAGMSVSTAGSSSSNTNFNISSSSAAGVGASASATSAGGDEITLADPEVVLPLVRPIGPYEPRVLAPLLKLMKPAPPIDAQELCEGLRKFHCVVQRAAAAAVLGAQTQPFGSPAAGRGAGGAGGAGNNTTGGAGGAAASKSKKDAAPSAAGTDGSEGKKRGAKHTAAAGGGGGAGSHHAGGSSTYTSGVPIGASHDVFGQRQRSASLTPQLTLLSVLTALLFHPRFVQSRLQFWEQELAELTRTVAAAAPTTTTISSSSAAAAAAVVRANVASAQGKAEASPSAVPAAAGGSAGSSGPTAKPAPRTSTGATASTAAAAAAAPPPTPLARLFHRVQALKTHAARVEAAARAKSDGAAPASTGEAYVGCFVSPARVLMAYK